MTAALTAQPVAAPARPRTVLGVPLRALVPDWIAVAVLTAVMIWEYLTPLDDGSRPQHILVPLSVAASVLAYAPILVRRFAPGTALAVSACALGLPGLVAPVWTLFYSGFVPAVFLVYSVARYRPLRVALAASALLVVAQAVGTARSQPQAVLPNTVFLITFEVVGVALGVALRRSAAQRARLAELLARVEAEEVDRERLALLDERAALARDLHDVVAHAVSLMLVQAGAARLAVRDDPRLARQLLAGVEAAGRDASTDLRRLLEVLRAEIDADPATAAPGLAGLDALVDRMRAAGLELEASTIGAPPVLPGGLDVTAYRIVQEALTNVLKHAGPTRAQVHVAYGDPIRITVRDDGPRTPLPTPGPSGHGLVGMQERAALFGGRVDAGRVGPGFEVVATLPLPEPA